MNTRDIVSFLYTKTILFYKNYKYYLISKVGNTVSNILCHNILSNKFFENIDCILYIKW